MQIDHMGRCCTQCGARQYEMCAWPGCLCHHRHVQGVIAAEITEAQAREHDEADCLDPDCEICNYLDSDEGQPACAA